ncbi:hypothetical protein [Herbidospora daliensis]|uniref:hypothetical protein n=1 Tax=Herbidospora daliensis TaxID=295585 RepID=UPI000784ADEA|nr:hypothetical protein [Herbidospora daliensis]
MIDPTTLAAGDVMTRVVVTVTPDESPIMAWELMRKGDMQDIATGCPGHTSRAVPPQVGDLIESTRRCSGWNP